MTRKKAAFLIAGITLLIAAIVAFSLSLLADSWSVQDPVKYYQAAVTQFPRNQSIQLWISTQTTTTVGSETFEESSRQELTLLYDNGNFLRGSMNEELTIGNSSVVITESLQDGILYITLDGSRFSAQCSTEDYLARYAPGILINENNYASIEGTATKKDITIQFREPTSIDTWGLPDGAELIDAEARAILAKDNTLLKSECTLRFRQNSMTVDKRITVEPTLAENLSISAIEDPSAYMLITNPDAPKTLERMSGYLLQAKAVESDYDEYIYCAAFGDERTRSIRLAMHEDESWSAEVETDVTLANSSRIGDATKMHQREAIQDGVYTIQIDGTEAEPAADATAEALRSYCRDLLVGTILMPQHIASVEIQQQENSYTLLFTATDTLAALLDADACQTLYNDTSVLGAIATDTETDPPQCYLTVSEATGLPIASGIRHRSSYTVTDLPYELIFETEQRYHFPHAEQS